MKSGSATTADSLPLPVIRRANVPSVADQVFGALQHSILSLELPPSSKISEADVARRMGVSRQPVREAFKRLAKLGFLSIRPQSGTTVSLISEEDVLRARFIRTALEIQTVRTACATLTPDGLAALRALIEEQRAAVAAGDREVFHKLDDRFHQDICIAAGVGYVWDVIQDSKVHIDRIRMLSLNPNSQRLALDEHIAILDAIAQGDADAAAAGLAGHLSRISLVIDEMKTKKHAWFAEGAD